MAGFTFFVDPGRRVYVRRVNIVGNGRTQDAVIRRELRQLENSWYSLDKIARSKERLQRTGYFSEVNIETPAVAGTADQVDVGGDGHGAQHGQPQLRRRLLAGRQPHDLRLDLAGQHLRLRQPARLPGQQRLGQPDLLALVPEPVLDRRRRGRRHRRLPPQRGHVAPSRSRSLPDEVHGRRRQLRPADHGVRLHPPGLHRRAHDAHARPAARPAALLRLREPVRRDDQHASAPTIGYARDTRDSLIYPTRGWYTEVGLEVGLPPGDLTYYRASLQQQFLYTPRAAGLAHPAAERRARLRGRLQRQAAALLQELLCGRRGLGARLRGAPRWGRAT